MKNSLRCSASALALASALAVVSVNAYPDSATGGSRATITTLVTISSAILTSSESKFVSGLTGDLIVRLPGTGPFEEETSYLNSVESALLAGSSNNCIPCGGSLADYIRQRAEDGMLIGNPVSSITLDGPGSSQPDSGSINITVAYN